MSEDLEPEAPILTLMNLTASVPDHDLPEIKEDPGSFTPGSLVLSPCRPQAYLL